MNNFDAVTNAYEILERFDNQIFESIIESLYTSFLNEGDNAVDVGAHQGRHTIPLARVVGDHGKIIAFEPLPNMFKILKNILQTNNLSGNVTTNQIALSNFEGDAKFINVVDAPGLSGLRKRTSQEGHNLTNINVKTMKLDNMVSSRDKIAFIKIDAEGADFYILQGATRILREDRPLVVFESGRINAFPAKSYGYTEEEFNEFFKAQEYVLYDIAGFKYNSEFWAKPTLNDFVAIPAEKENEYRELLLASVLTELGKYALA